MLVEECSRDSDLHVLNGTPQHQQVEKTPGVAHNMGLHQSRRSNGKKSIIKTTVQLVFFNKKQIFSKPPKHKSIIKAQLPHANAIPTQPTPI